MQNDSIQTDLCNIHNAALFYSAILFATIHCSILLCSTLLCSTLLYPTLLYSTLLYSTLLYYVLYCSAIIFTPLIFSAQLHSTQHLNDHNKVTAIPCGVTDSRRVEAHLVFRQNSHEVLQNNLPPNYFTISTEKNTFIKALIRKVCVCF